MAATGIKNPASGGSESISKLFLHTLGMWWSCADFLQTTHRAHKSLMRHEGMPALNVSALVVAFFGFIGNLEAASGMRFCHGVSQHLRRAGVAFKLEQRIVTETAGIPEAEIVLTDQRGDVVLVQQPCIGCRVLQIPEHIRRQPGYTVHADVGQGFMPPGLLVDFCAQTKGAGSSKRGGISLQYGVKVNELRPDQHPHALAEVLTVGGRFFHSFAAIGGEVNEKMSF